MKFKTEAEYNMKSIRFLLLTITSMFIIIAGLMIVLGFSVYTHFHSFSFFYENASTGKTITPSILCILLGMFLLIVTLFGFFGSLKQSTCMVNLYAFILFLIFIVTLVVVILSFTMDTQSMQSLVYIPISQYTSDPEVASEIDLLQRSLNCCGSYSFLDYDELDFTSNHSTSVISTIINGEQAAVVVPESCCIFQGPEFCTTMRSSSCKMQVVNLILQNSIVIGVLGVSVMFVQLLGIIFALLLARCIRRVKSERGLMSWNIKEQMIIARQSDENRMQLQNSDDSVYIPPHESSVA